MTEITSNTILVSIRVTLPNGAVQRVDVRETGVTVDTSPNAFSAKLQAVLPPISEDDNAVDLLIVEMDSCEIKAKTLNMYDVGFKRAEDEFYQLDTSHELLYAEWYGDRFMEGWSAYQEVRTDEGEEELDAYDQGYAEAESDYADNPDHFEYTPPDVSALTAAHGEEYAQQYAAGYADFFDESESE